jgi:hypothetical protein
MPDASLSFSLTLALAPVGIAGNWRGRSGFGCFVLAVAMSPELYLAPEPTFDRVHEGEFAVFGQGLIQ